MSADRDSSGRAYRLPRFLAAALTGFFVVLAASVSLAQSAPVPVAAYSFSAGGDRA